MAKKIAKVSVESKLELNETEYLDSFSPHMMDVVHSWCNHASFAEIVQQTTIFEGMPLDSSCSWIVINVILRFRFHHKVHATTGRAAQPDDRRSHEHG